MVLLLIAAAGAAFLFTILDNGPGARSNSGPGPGNTFGGKPLMTEFGDFQCLHCARFALHVLPALEQDLIDPGTIRFEYRHYPFLGPESFAAAEASECARDQGKFHQYHLKLYRMTIQGERHTTENLLATARDLGLEPGAFNQCLKSGAKQARVLEDREYGKSLGVRGTPTLFLEGERLNWDNYVDLRKQVRRIAAERESPGVPPATE